MDLTPEEVASEKAKGHKFGIYNGFRPGMGAVVSDADAVEFRVMPWIVWKYNIDQYFYWSTTFWRKLNVFVNPLLMKTGLTETAHSSIPDRMQFSRSGQKPGRSSLVNKGKKLAQGSTGL